MKLLLHDLEPEVFERISQSLPKDIEVISKGDKRIQKCIGCFKCWTKTPGMCVIQDGFGNIGGMVGRSDEYIIISRIVYGSYSPFVKNVLDRNINYVMPFFEKRNGEMHHSARYQNQIRFTVIGYGDDLTEGEKTTFKNLVRANGINFNVKDERCLILAKPEEIMSVTKEVWA